MTPSTNASKIEVWQGRDRQFYWRAKGRNGETIATGEGFTRLADAKRAATDLLPSVPVEVLPDETYDPDDDYPAAPDA